MHLMSSVESGNRSTLDRSILKTFRKTEFPWLKINLSEEFGAQEFNHAASFSYRMVTNLRKIMSRR